MIDWPELLIQSVKVSIYVDILVILNIAKSELLNLTATLARISSKITVLYLT